MTVIYLIRHGATAANREVPYRLQGRGLDLPLDEVGRDQVQRAARALTDIPFAAVYASPLLRARETGEIIARPRSLRVDLVTDLTEANLGRWEGLTWDEASAQDPDHHRRFHANSGTVPYPDGESFLDVQARVTPALARIAADHPGESVAVIGHNVTCRSYLSGLMGIPIDKARAIRQANGGINVVQYEGGVPLVVTINSCLHVGH